MVWSVWFIMNLTEFMVSYEVWREINRRKILVQQPTYDTIHPPQPKPKLNKSRPEPKQVDNLRVSQFDINSSTMKLYLSLLAVSAASASAFTAGVQKCQPRATASSSYTSIVAGSCSSNTALQMSDFDFPSAMPAKPELTMKQKMEESATQFIADLTMRLADGVEPPVELIALKKARDDENSDEKILALRIYELMIGK